MKTTKITLIAAFAVAMIAAPAGADHRDILIALDNNGQIVTGTVEVISSPPAPQIGQQTFGFHPSPFSGEYYTGDPGYNAMKQEDLPAGYSALPGDADLKFDIVADTIEGVTANFWYWDGVDDDSDGDYYDDVDWSPVPTGYTYEFSKSGRMIQAFADGTGDAVPGFTLDKTSPDGGLHKHLDMFLDDGDADTATYVQDGFYLVGIDLYMDEPGVHRSETLYFVPAVGDHTPAQHRDGAVAWVNDNVVPEPASLSLLAIGGLAVLRRRRKA